MGVISNTLYDVENIYSLDFETTGTAGGARVWSVGFSGSGINKEFFIADAIRRIDPMGTDSEGRPYPRSIQEQLMEAHRQTGAEYFGGKQMASGSFKPYEDALLARQGTNMTTAIEAMNAKLLKDPGIILIQNANFENARLLNAYLRDGEDGTAASKASVERLVRDVLGRDLDYLESRNVINTSDDIFLARKSLQEAILGVKLEKHGLEKAIEANNNLRDTINKEIRSKVSRGFSVPIELMDLTTMLQMDMAEKGLINSNSVGYGRGVEVLSKLLLNQVESHRALDDAKTQLGIYEVYKQASTEIQKGNPPEYLKPYIRALDQNEGNIHDIDFLKNIRSRVEEVYKKKESLSQKQLDDIISAASNHYLHAPETNVDRHLVAAKIKEGTDAESVMKIIDDFQERIPKLNGDPLVSIPEIPKAMNIDTKLAIGAGVLGGIALISALSNRDKKPDRPTTYNELYEDVRLGSAYADWKERNNSHRTIY